MSDAKSIAKNVASLYIGEMVSQILAFFLVVAIAKQLGDVGLGKYSFAFSFVTIFLILADMGLPTLITKEVAKNRKLAKLHMTKTFTLKLLLNIAAFIVMVAAIFISRRDYETVLLVALAAVAMFFYNLAGIYRSMFQAFETMKYEAYSRVVERLIAASLGIFLLYRGYGIFSLFFVLIFSNFAYYIFLYMLAKAKISAISFDVDGKSWKQSLKEAMPFWITVVFITLYFKIDTIMLGFMKGYATTGWYNAALKIIEVLTKIPFLMINAIFPTLSKFHKFSYEKTMLLYKKSFYYMVILALPISTGLVMLADRIIIHIYSADFTNSIIALQILASSLVFVFVNYLMGYLLNAVDRQRLFTLTVCLTTVLNVILNLALIPKYSYVGSSAATLISEVLSFSMLYYFTSKNNFRISAVKMLAKPLIANAAMIALILYFKNLHLFLIIAISALAYFSVLLLIKGFGQDETNILKSFIQRK